MELRQLRHFLAVADTLHFGRAAERLGMTQPPLSQSILALERELQAALFKRSKRSVALTSFGRQWLDHVRPVVGDFDRLADTAREIREGTAGKLTLSFVSTADYSILPSLVERFSLRYPDVRVALVEATSDVQMASLVEGAGQAGLIIPPHGNMPDALDYEALWREPLVVAVPQSWMDDGRLPAAGEGLAGDALGELPLIHIPRRIAPIYHDLVVGFFARLGVSPQIRQEAIQMQTIISLVSAGMGIALVPASLRNLARTGVRYLDIAGDAPTLETGIAWRRDDDTPTLRNFLEIAREVAGPR